MTPVFAPLQTTLVDVGVSVIAFGCVILKVEVRVQRFASRMVTVRVPALKPVTEEVVCPPGAQVYVYAGVPPVTTTPAVPFVPALQLTFELVAVTESAGGWAIETDAIASVHPLTSVMVAEIGPEHKVPEFTGTDGVVVAEKVLLKFTV